MPWRSKQASAASTIAARVRAACSFVLRICYRVGSAGEAASLHSFANVYNGRLALALPGTSAPMTAFSKRRFALFSFFVLAALAAGCSKQGGDAAAKQGAGGPPQAMPVTAVRVSMQKLPISIEAVGQAEGSRQVEIRSRVSGILEKRLYDEGAAVAANAPLFLIDPVPYELAVQEAKAALAQATVARDVAEADAKRLGPLVQEK